jgi:HK97 family phage prohead protease
MKAFFDRHQSDEKADGFNRGDAGYPSNGKIANLLWGGPSGYSWAKKVVEQMEAADRKDSRSLRPFGSTHGMKPRVKVVHGAPGSGKSEYVWSSKGEDDVVFDFDKVMSALSGLPYRQSSKHLISYCTDIRTLILKKALYGHANVGTTWIITTRLGDDLSGMLSDIPVEYIEMPATKDECLKRVSESPEWQPVIEEIKQVIDEYFAEREEQRAVDVRPGVERRYLGNFSYTEKADPNLLRVERRADPETGKPRTYLVGYAAVFGKDSLMLGDFIERIHPDAFQIVKDRQDEDGKPLETRCLFNHSPDHLLGRFPTTMRMTVDDKGLRYECLLPESRGDLAELVQRGDLKGSSFSFVVSPDGGEEWKTENGQSIRIVKKIRALLDCGPVTYPAYGDASVSVAKRSYEAHVATARPVKRRDLSDVVERAKGLRSFLAERRDCGRDEGGRFGSGNKCRDEEGGVEPPARNPAGGDGGRDKETVELSPKPKDTSPKYMEVSPPMTKTKAKAAQKFIDDAREGQLARGGKGGGKSDDGGGVQTWSKGDDFPWTTQQVGTDEGYLQAQHPDGSKTEKYPFSGGDTKSAMDALKAELKKKKKPDTRSLVAKTVLDTMKFLRERR